MDFLVYEPGNTVDGYKQDQRKVGNTFLFVILTKNVRYMVLYVMATVKFYINE